MICDFDSSLKRLNVKISTTSWWKIWTFDETQFFFLVQLFSFFRSSLWNIFVTTVLCASSIKLFVCVALSTRRRRTFDFNAISISTRVSFTTQLHRLLCECSIEWDLQRLSSVQRYSMTTTRWINANCCAAFRRRRVFMLFFVWSTQNLFQMWMWWKSICDSTINWNQNAFCNWLRCSQVNWSWTLNQLCCSNVVFLKWLCSSIMWAAFASAKRRRWIDLLHRVESIWIFFSHRMMKIEIV